MSKPFSISIFLTLLSVFAYDQVQPLETINTTIAVSGNYAYAKSLQELIEGERWGFHSGAIGIPEATSTLSPQGRNNYKIENIHDLDLSTAWMEGSENYGIGESFTITFDWKEEFQGFGKVYNFYGIIEIFNGYCKSEKLWRENSRIKRLKMYYNDEPICLIELADSWQYQKLDIRKFFNSKTFPDAKIEALDGGQLRFEIMEVYKGKKFKDTGLSEFVFQSPAN